MSDIILCSSIHCPVRSTCYRSSAKIKESPVWSNFEYFCNEDNGFADYIPMAISEDKNIVNAKSKPNNLRNCDAFSFINKQREENDLWNL